MFLSFSMWSCILNHCTFSQEDLTAAPPGSPLALPLIYSLIHLYCCHMASLSLPPHSSTPTIIPLSLPPPSHISELLISRASQSRHAPPFSHPSLPPTFLFPSSSRLSLSASPRCCNRALCLLRLCCSSLPRSAQI